MMLVVIAGGFAAECASAENGAPEAVADSPETVESGVDERSWSEVVWGQRAADKLYLGLWSHHFLDGDDGHRTDNDLIGVAYRGWFLGTFVNSDDDRSYSAGVQRDVYRRSAGNIRFDAGYRLGLLYGYDSYQIGNSKLFPALQLYGDLSFYRLGVQFSWAAEVVTAGFFLRLD
jgi:hypothetical protein